MSACIHWSLLLAFLIAGLWPVASSGQAQSPDGAAQRLVALLVDENLPRASGNRGVHLTSASRAAEKLIELGDLAVPALREALRSKAPLQRLNAAYVLARIDTAAALAGRLEAATSEDNAVRAVAIESLPVYTDGEAQRVVWAALADSSREVQQAAMQVYVRRMDKDRPSNIVRYHAAQKISGLLKDKELRPTAAWVLGHLKSNVAAAPLLAALDDDRPEVRFEILASLTDIGDKQTTLGILPALRDPAVTVRCAAAAALAKLRDLRSTAALVTALADSEAFVRRDAATALGKIGDVRAAASLLPLLDDRDENVSRSAAGALAEIGDRQAVPALLKVLARPQDAEPSAAALGQLGDPRAIAGLGRYLEQHPDSTTAAQALAKIRHPEAVAELARIASKINSIAARRGLRAIADVGFDFDGPERVAQWWQENREHFLQPLPR